MIDMSENQRKSWVDGLRGLAMLFVIYGHLCRGVRPFSVFANPVKLPLFFAVTGYVFNFRGGDTRAFLSRMFRRLILPYLCFAALYTGVKILQDPSAAGIRTALLELISGNVAWYIPCCILAELVFFGIQKLARGTYAQCALMLAASVGGYFLSKLPGTPALIVSRCLIVQLYIMIGHAFRGIEPRLRTRPGWKGAIFAAAYLGMGAWALAHLSGVFMDVQSNTYSVPALCAAMIVCGLCCLLYYARFARMPRWLVFIGQNTLIFYLFHSRIIDMMKPLIRRIPYALRSGIPGLTVSVMLCALLCGLCAVCSVLINRYLPFLAGRGKTIR